MQIKRGKRKYEKNDPCLGCFDIKYDDLCAGGIKPKYFSKRVQKYRLFHGDQWGCQSWCL